MANTVREDVVKISFDTNSSALSELNSGMEEIKNSAAEMNGTDPFEELYSGAEESLRNVGALSDNMGGVKSAVSEIASDTTFVSLDNDIQTFDTSAALARDKLTAMWSAMQNIRADPIKTVRDAVSSLKTSVGNTINDVKTLAATKIDNLKNNFNKLKKTLTQGEQGAKGFWTALKNIGKISVVKISNGVKSMGPLLQAGAAKAKEFANKLKEAASVGFEKLGSGIKSATSQLGSGLKSVAKVGVAAVTAGAVAVGGMTTAAINVGREFESSMSQVAATMGLDTSLAEDKAQFDILSNAAKEMGATTAFSASEASEALNYLALAGYDATKAATALPTVLHLAGAGGMALGDASDLITDAMSALNIEVDKAGLNLTKFADQMAVTAQKSNTSVSQLGEAILTVGGTASNMAGGTTELNAALGVLANRGIKGAEGGTHLRNMMLSLQNPTSDAEKMLKKFGVSVYDASGKMRGINDIFGDLQKGMNGMSDAEVDNVLSTIFNKTDLAATRDMLAGCGDEFDNLVAEIQNSSGACEDMYETMLDNLNGDIDIFKSGLSGLGIEVYEGLQEPLRQFVQEGSGMIDRLTNAFRDGGFNGLVEEFGNVLADALTLMASYVPKILQMGTSLIQSLVTGIASNMGTITTAVSETAITFIEGLSSFLPQLLLTGVDMILNLANGIVESLPYMITSAVSCITTFIEGLFQRLPQIISVGLSLVQSLVTGIVQNIPTIIQSAINCVTKFIQGIIPQLPNILQSGIQIIITLVGGLIKAIPQLLAAIPKIIGAIIDTIFNTNWIEVGGNIIKGIGSGIVNGVKSVFGKGEATDSTKNASESIAASFGSGSSEALTQGENLSESFTSGILNNTDSAKIAASNISAETANLFETDLTQAGQESVSTFATGIEQSSESALSEVKNISDDVTKLKETINADSEEIKNAFRGIVDDVELSMDGIIDATEETLSIIEARFTMFGENISGVSDGFETIRISISSITDEIMAFPITTSISSAMIVGVVRESAATIVVIAKTTTETLHLMADKCAIKIKSSFTSIKLISVGEQMMTGLIVGMNNKRSAVLSTAYSIANAISYTMRRALEINSPSKVTEEIGEYTALGIPKGLRNMQSTVQDEAKETAMASIPFAESYDSEAESNRISNTYTRSRNTTVYSPQFNLTVSGTNDDRATARKVKKMVAEAIEETFESLDRKRPAPRRS